MLLRSACYVLLLTALGPISPAQQGVTKPAIQAPPVAQETVSPAQAAPADLPGPSSTTYIIGPGDTISITVWKSPEMSGNSIPVRPDGMVTLPLLGDLTAAGFTPMSLSTDVSKRIRKYVQDPVVSVSVLAVKPKEIYLLGEVLHVGPLAITPEMTPLQAIASAGGLSPYAKSKQIYILRNVDQKQKKIFFDYKKAIKNGDLQGVTLIPGDTIVVP